MITLKDFVTDSDVTIVSILILFSGIYIVRSDHIRFGTWYYLLSGQYDYFLCNLKKISENILDSHSGEDMISFRSQGAQDPPCYTLVAQGVGDFFFSIQYPRVQGRVRSFLTRSACF